MVCRPGPFCKRHENMSRVHVISPQFTGLLTQPNIFQLGRGPKYMYMYVLYVQSLIAWASTESWRPDKLEHQLMSHRDILN